MSSSRFSKSASLSAILLLALATTLARGFGSRTPPPPPGPATAPALEEGWKEYPLSDGGAVTVTVRVRKEVSLAQRRWMQLVFNNTGAPLSLMNIDCDFRNAEITEPGKDPRTQVDLGSARYGSDIGFTSSNSKLRSGVSIADLLPSRYAVERLGGPAPGSVWHVRVPFRLNQFNRDVPLPAQGVMVEFDWRAPTKEELQQAGPLMKDVLHQPAIGNNDHNFLANVLQIDTIAATLTVDDGVAGLQNFRDLGPGRDAIIKVFAQQKPLDPKLIAYLQSAIEKRDGNVLGRELARPDSLWDDALIEPLVTAVEKPSVPGGLMASSVPWLQSLDAHPAGWQANEAITHRLGDAVLKGPYASRGNTLSFDAASQMGMSRDARFVSRLRPFLDDKTVVADDERSAMAARSPTLRACDLAYAALVKIRGEKDEFADERSRRLDRATFDAILAEMWTRWDKAIDALKAKIDKK